MLIKGIDASSWNEDKEFEGWCEQGDIHFVFIKATEGKSYVNPKLIEQAEHATVCGLRVGFYHYCRPDLGNEYIAEMAHFLSTVRKVYDEIPEVKECAIALDWEDKSLGNYRLWLAAAVSYLKNTCDINPIVYMSESSVVAETFHFTDAMFKYCALWAASWGKDTANVGHGKFPVLAFHQFTNRPIDQSYFNGNFEQLDKYFTYNPLDDVMDEGECSCHCMCGK